MEFSCCKKPYSIRYKLLHRTVTKQSAKHLLIPELSGEHGAEEQVGEAPADESGEEQDVLVDPVLESGGP